MNALSTNSPETLRLSIAGMRCAGCVESVETALRATEGVEKADVSFADHTAIVIGHPDPFALKAALKAAGYEGAIMTTEEDPNIEYCVPSCRTLDDSRTSSTASSPWRRTHSKWFLDTDIPPDFLGHADFGRPLLYRRP